jgi:tyrosyl-tRNA synthetase|tara:strand:- start:3950 stop:5221 length:1272 start_codon:yes stop_codon:yes gene_type:complete
MNFIKELQWRGMIHDIMPGTKEALNKPTAGYIGFDPTADSLHIGSLVQIMILVHLQQAGHRPIALVGGATGMVGDPSGKSKERNLLDQNEIEKNITGVRTQLEKFLNFDCGENSAELVNNYNWFKEMNFLDFIRDVGKHITVNYMMAKDSVKSRMETGISFTEFTYQLVQGYDYYWLNKNKGCVIQLGGSDQWGNIVTGTELIRRMGGGEAYAVTTPLIKKADGSKFGKTESGNVWLDRKRTSPYKFYQYWLNSSDEDAKTYIKIFTLKSEEEINSIIAEHEEAPHVRLLQKSLAEEITTRVHSKEDYEAAVEASNVLFGKSTSETLKNLSEEDMLSIFEGVPKAEISLAELEAGIDLVDLLVEKTSFLPSNKEARRAIKENSISLNKDKVTDELLVNKTHLVSDKYLLLQRGKKKYFLVKGV